MSEAEKYFEEYMRERLNWFDNISEYTIKKIYLDGFEKGQDVMYQASLDRQISIDND